MQTTLADWVKQASWGDNADRVLRACVHCGFCNATCPTYQELGNELDGPRGRIYLIKQVLEGQRPTAKTRAHLDRCLTCLNCETTCPSGVRYRELLEVGRHCVAEQAPARDPWQRAQRQLLNSVLPETRRFALLHRANRLLAPLLPKHLKPVAIRQASTGAWPHTTYPRRVLLPAGCVQPILAPAINLATARLLDRLSIQTIADDTGCCGALSHHLTDEQRATAYARRNIDAWWPHIEHGIEAIISTASGCGVQIKDYARLFADDPAYADKAARVSAMSRDISEYLAAQDIDALRPGGPVPTLAWHAPCTLQHGQRLANAVPELFARLGIELSVPAEAHLCCGSAGTYSVLEAELASRLRERKMQHLKASAPAQILTANIGCLHHLQAASDVPVRHWVDYLNEQLESKQT